MHYVHHVPGRLRLRVARLKGNATATQAACEALRGLNGVTHAAGNLSTGSITVRYDRHTLKVEDVWAVLRQGAIVASPLPDLSAMQRSFGAGASATGSSAAGKIAEAAIGLVVEALVKHSTAAMIAALI